MNIQRYIGFWTSLIAVAILPAAEKHLCRCSISDSWAENIAQSAPSESCCSGRQSSNKSSAYSDNCCCAVSCTQPCCDRQIPSLHIECASLHMTLLNLHLIPSGYTLETENPSVILRTHPYCNSSLQEKLCQLNC